jgi:hypothetical protein
MDCTQFAAPAPLPVAAMLSLLFAPSLPIAPLWKLRRRAEPDSYLIRIWVAAL